MKLSILGDGDDSLDRVKFKTEITGEILQTILRSCLKIVQLKNVLKRVSNEF